jgi:RNA polymerase sigma-70 factor (ECF subfamily)
MTVIDAGGADPRVAFGLLLGELRPKLHRYCARMTGSSIDGEDVVQEGIVKAIEAFPAMGEIANPEGWVFRIVHNAALDFLRRRGRLIALTANAEPDTVVDPSAAVDDRQTAAASLRTLMRLPVAHRSSVILMDVLGYSLEEIAGVTEMSVAAVKAALHRGRTRLRELAAAPDDLPLPRLAASEHALLAAYVDRFNARDFDAIRDMLADEVRLEVVDRSRANGKAAVGGYFGNYDRLANWRLVPGLVDGRPAVLVLDTADRSGRPGYFILLDWVGDRLASIRDFRHARYAAESAELIAAE